jgi:2-succinyl-6-hydroxy-2,4-cyclohexadiene-1-carboxylate synthase
MNVRSQAPPARRTAPTTRVIFVPGFMQRGSAWAPVAELLPERYSSVLLDHEQQTLSGRLEEIETAAGEDQPALVGYSLGGRVALRAALRNLDRFGALATIGAGAGIDDPGARTARAEADERMAAWMEVTPIEEIVQIWERQPLFADQSDALVDEQRPGRLSHAPRDLALLMRTAGQGAMEPFWFELGRLDMPLLALSGSRDERYTAAARRLAREAPNATALAVADAGHAAHLQQPAEVARLLTEFLDGTRAR